jgi:eukaryotic-like serine/threonine-protein kinase
MFTSGALIMPLTRVTLAQGTRLGVFEIRGPLGQGGMGVVYRAHDTQLKREVAIKVLPEAVARDPERLARFQREAELLATLNHPNIAAIYGFEQSTSGVESGHLVRQALVLELVEGPTLADRLVTGPMTLEDAIPVARQIAEALEAAHEQNIIHRDLKPANIKLRADGTVKVLDFGLAKLVEGDRSGTGIDLTQSPTITSPAVMSRTGAILGTAAYMSPEQAKGQPADKRSDVWAFGCVLFEMLAGRSTFEGDSVGELVAAVIKSEPDWQRLPPETPDTVRRLLRRCLEKDRRRRLQAIGDARIEIEEWQRGQPAGLEVAAPLPARRARLPWLVAAVVAVVAALEPFWLRARPDSLSREVRFEVATPTTTDPISLAVSPDSSKIVFIATFEGRPRLWLRSLDGVSARPLAGTDDAFYPFWSPDSRSIGFFASGGLKRLDLDTGLVRQLATAPNPLGGTWIRDGTILFAPNFTGPIFKMAASGGDAVPVTQMERGEASHRFPQMLPDNDRFLYFAAGSANRAVFVGRIAGGPGSRLIDADAPAVYTTGQLLFVRQGTLFSQPFDPASQLLSGNPVAVAEQIPMDGLSGLAALSVSNQGTVIYRSGPAGAERQLTWFDRSGRELSKVGAADALSPMVSMSPDERRLGISRSVAGNSDIWTVDLTRGVMTRITFDPASEPDSVWSPDGSRVAFNSNRSGVYDLYVKSITDPKEDLLLATPQNKAPTDWSLDGKFLLYRSPGATTGFDLWALPLEGDRKPFPVVQTEFEERDGQFSPDGQWVAYQSNASGRVEIYVQPFRGGNREQVSTNGGAQVRWRRDGKELFYIALDGRLMSVAIQMNAATKTLEAGIPTPLFSTRVGGAVQAGNFQQYVVSADGQRFLMSTITETHTPAITVVLNWRPKQGAQP